MDSHTLKRSLHRLAFLVLALVLIFSVQVAIAQSDQDLFGYGWASNIGWVSFNCEDEGVCGSSDYKVALDGQTNNLSGYAWSSNIGWISFNTADVAGCPNSDCQPRYDGVSKLLGWARALNGEDPNVQNVTNENDFYRPWGAEYEEPPRTDTTPSGDTILAHVCVDGDNGEYTDVMQTYAGLPPEGNPDTWEEKAPIPVGRTALSGDALDGKVYVLGGTTRAGGSNHQDMTDYLDIYDPETDTWSAGASLPGRRARHDSAALNGKIYLAGGQAGRNESRCCDSVEDKDNFWSYDPATDTWDISLATLLEERSDFGLAALDGKIYLIAGMHDGSSRNSMHEYDPVTDTWTSFGPGSSPISGQVEVLTHNGKIYALDTGNSGGDGDGDGGSGGGEEIYSYTPSEGWTQLHTGTHHIEESAFAASVSKLYRVGGAANFGSNNEYDPVVNLWGHNYDDHFHPALMPTSRRDLVAVGIGCKIYAIAGNAGSSIRDENEVYDATDCFAGEPARYHDRSVTCSSVTEEKDVSSGWDGWISLSGDTDSGGTYAVTLSGNDFDGFAWGSHVLGWMSWDGVALGTPQPGVCNDGIDNDGDGLIDSNDPDCAECGQEDDCGTPDVCTDGLDNDGDGLIDGDDPDCAECGQEDPCGDPPPGVCEDGIDNDGDGLIDSNDPDCVECDQEEDCGDGGGPGVCEDGVDNDGDGLIDSNDPDCAECGQEDPCDGGSGGPSCPADGPGNCPQCNDNFDNDGDGAVDSSDNGCWTDPDDSSTYDPNDDDEELTGDLGGDGDPGPGGSCPADPPVPGECAGCGDGIDNDGDGLIDAFGYCEGAPSETNEADCDAADAPDNPTTWYGPDAGCGGNEFSDSEGSDDSTIEI